MTDEQLTPPPSEIDPGQALDRRQLANAASLIMLAMVAAGVLGLVRQMAISAAFGAGQELDAFYAASRVPETLFTLVAGGALGSAFIPVFANLLAADQFQKAWALASAVLTYVALAALLLSGLAMLFAEPLVRELLWEGGSSSQQELTVSLMRIMLLTVVVFSTSGLVMGILNGYQHFFVSALAPALYNVGIILGALLLAPRWGVHGLAWGVVLGALLHLMVQLPILRGLPYLHLHLNFNWRQEGTRQVLWLMGPRVLGLGIVQINFWVNTALASEMPDGSLTALSVAFQLMFVVLGVLGQSLGTAVFPSLSRLYAEKQYDKFWDTMTNTLGMVLFLSIPAGFGLAALAHPIIQVVFERGEWTANDTAGAAWALALFSIGLAGHAALEILARAFYSLQDTWTPVKIGGLTMLLNILLSLVFIRLMGYPDNENFARGSFGGLALAMSIATALETLVLWWLLRLRIRQRTDGGVLRIFWRTLAASGGMALVLWAWQSLATGQLPMLALLLGGIVLGLLSFWLLALLLQLEAARAIPRLIMQRLKGRGAATAG